MLSLESSIAWPRKTDISWENMQQYPKPKWQMTIQNNADPVYKLVKTIDFNLEVIEDCYTKFYLSLISR